MTINEIQVLARSHARRISADASTVLQYIPKGEGAESLENIRHLYQELARAARKWIIYCDEIEAAITTYRANEIIVDEKL